MGEADGSWCLIESDPGVFTELIKEFGVKGLQVEELWSLEQESFETLGKVHGLVFLFKWMNTPNFGGNSQGSVVQDSRLDNIFFARQVIQNACATQAIVSILLNLSSKEIEMGDVLTEFKEFTRAFDPAMKGLALSNSEVIRGVHNSFARQSVFEFDNQKSSKDKDEDVFHFVSYIPLDGRLYELDGLHDGPIDLGAVPSGIEWTAYAATVLRDRISKYQEGEIHFSLLAVIADRKQEFERRLAELTAAPNAESPSKKAEIVQLKKQLHDEDLKRQKYRLENIRRKHNYLPLIVQFLKELAEQKQLVPLYEKAKEKTAKMKKEGETAKSGGNGK